MSEKRTLHIETTVNSRQLTGKRQKNIYYRPLLPLSELQQAERRQASNLPRNKQLHLWHKQLSYNPTEE